MVLLSRILPPDLVHSWNTPLKCLTPVLFQLSMSHPFLHVLNALWQCSKQPQKKFVFGGREAHLFFTGSETARSFYQTTCPLMEKVNHSAIFCHAKVIHPKKIASLSHPNLLKSITLLFRMKLIYYDICQVTCVRNKWWPILVTHPQVPSVLTLLVFGWIQCYYN